MKKTIAITVVAIFLIIPLEKVKGQSSTVITSAESPSVNVLTGVHAKLSVGHFGIIGMLLPIPLSFFEFPIEPQWLRRFEWFVELRPQWQLFDQKMTTETSSWDGVENREYNSHRFIALGSYGFDVRIIGNNYLRSGASGAIINQRAVLRGARLGYVRKQNLSERARIDLSALLVIEYQDLLFPPSGDDINPFFISYNGLMFSARFNYEIARNLSVGVHLGYTRRFSTWASVENVEAITIPNLIDFSVGLHYHIYPRQIGRRSAETNHRPRQQRVSPHQRALPCPPGQVRHQRSWDRPPSIFNHPSGR